MCTHDQPAVLAAPAQADRSRSVQEDADGQSSLERFLTVFHDFDEHLLSMVQSADASTVTEHGLYERPVSSIPDEVISLFMHRTCPCKDNPAHLRVLGSRRAGAGAW